MSAFVLAIVGGSAAGKTTLAAAVRDALAPARTLIMAEDDYYVPRGAGDPMLRNYDEPAAKDLALFGVHLSAAKRREAFERPIYDFALHDRVGAEPVAPADFVIVDGMHALGFPGVRGLVDWAVFLAAPPSERLKRRVARDVLERGRTPQSVEAQFEAFVAPMHETYVEPLAALTNETLIWRPEMGLCAQTEGRRLADLMRAPAKQASIVARAADER